MGYLIKVADSDIVFEGEDGETVLEAAERCGFDIPYSCRKGVCSSCEAELREGTAALRGRAATGPDQRILLCQAIPAGDVVIAPKRISRMQPPERSVCDMKVFRIERVATDVVILGLRLPAGRRAKFHEGQYLRVLFPDGDSRSYSMANPPHKSDGVQLHIRQIPGGRFSDVEMARLAVGDTLKVELPFGTFLGNADHSRPAILLVSGTGFATAHSLIETHIRNGESRPVHLYWGGRRLSDLYSDAPQRWLTQAPWLRYTPVLSEPDGDWRGSTGLVHSAVLEDYPDLSRHEVYACGNPLMVQAAERDFTSLAQLKPASFFCDAFVPSGDRPNPEPAP